MDMIDPVRKSPDKFRRINALPFQVTRIKIETESLPTADGFQRPLGSYRVKGDFSGMYLQGKFNTVFVKHVQDGMPHLGKILKTIFDILLAVRRKRINHMPNGRPGKSVDDL